MVSLITAELISVVVLIICILGLTAHLGMEKSTRRLIAACLLCILSNLSDAGATVLNGSGLPDALLYVINFFSYISDGLCYIAFADYCHELIGRHTKNGFLLFRLPAALMTFSVFYIAMEFVTGHLVRFNGGVCTMLSGIPDVCRFTNLVAFLWLPAAALILILQSKPEASPAVDEGLGLRAVLLLGSYSVLPLIVNILAIVTDTLDYSSPATALGLFTVSILLQNEIFHQRDQERQRLLAEKNAAQNARLTEITALNAQLKDNQSRQEEAAAKQAAQLAEVTALNARLSEEHTRLSASIADSEASGEGIRRIHEVLGSGSWAVWYDEDGTATRVEWSDNLRRILGYTDKTDFPDTLGSFIGAIHPDDTFRVLGATEVDIHSREDRPGGGSMVFRMRKKSGEYRWFRNSAQSVRREDSSVAQFYGILQDITDIENTRSELAEAMEAISAVNESLGAATWKIYCNLDGFPSRCSWGESARKLLGYAADEFPDSADALTSKLHPEDKKGAVNAYWAAVRSGSQQRLFRATCRILTKDRGYRWYRAAARLTRNPDGSPKILYGILMDVDSYQLGIQDLKAQKTLAETSDREKTEFLYSLSHDLRTPANAILGYAERIRENPDDREKTTECIQKLESSGQALLSLLDNVLEMASLSSGRSPLKETVSRTGELSASVLTILEPQIAKKHITFTSAADLSTPCILCDTGKVREIYLNLLSNALRYTPEGGSITLTLTEQPITQPGFVTIVGRVSDNGPGISPDFLPHIFEPFARGEDADVSSLGLPVAKKLAELMGGTLTAESEPGKGSCFTVTLTHRIPDAPEK